MFCVECNLSLDGKTWFKVSEDMPSEADMMSYTLVDLSGIDPCFYLVVKSFP